MAKKKKAVVRVMKGLDLKIEVDKKKLVITVVPNSIPRGKKCG